MSTARQNELALGQSLPSHEGGDIVARTYQAETIDNVMAWWMSRPTYEYPLVVLPTASGKTIIFSLLIRRIIEEWPHVRVLILAHTKELLDQAEQKILRVWPEADTGIYCAGLNRREIRQVTIASRDSFVSIDDYEPFDIVIVDEAHRIGEDEKTRYQTILATLTELNQKLCAVGFTATPYRTDAGYVYGPGQIFNGVAYEKSVREMIREGYLCEIRAAAVDNVIDTSGLRTRMGDFAKKQLGERVASRDLLDRQIEEWSTHASSRQLTAFFCVNVEHAEMTSERLLERDYVVPALHGKTPAPERAQILAQAEAGQIDGIANVGVLTEGWDCPRLDCIALLRPTKSLGLFIQMVGRGLRTHPGKNDCLLLDFGGNLSRFGPIDRAKPAQRANSRQEERVKTCEGCSNLVPSAASVCPHCGNEFGTLAKECEACGAENRPAAAQCEACGALLMPDEVEAKASTNAVLSDQEVHKRDVQCFEVRKRVMEAQTSQKSGKRYLRVYYDCGQLFSAYSDIICLGYEGFPGRKAAKWLREALKPQYDDMPLNVDPDTFLAWDQQMGGLLKEPRAIYVDLSTKWNDVTYTEYWTEGKAAAIDQLSRLLANAQGDDVFDDDIPF